MHLNCYLIGFTQLVLYIWLLLTPQTYGKTSITSITPNIGSTAGGTRLTIYGSGFSHDQFSYDVPSRGNIVYLSSDRSLLPCDVITYLSNSGKITCDTRSSPSSEVYKVILFVDGIRISEDNGTYCGGQCNYKYSESVSPTITAVTPRSGLPGTIITIRGRLFTSSVNSIQELENGLSETKEIVRIFFGSTSICDPIDPVTSNLYGAAMDSETSTEGYIKCKISTTMIDSINGSLIVSTMGRSVRTSKSLVVDFGLNLYLFQTHAEILDINPRSGSIEGGTIVKIAGQHLGGYLNKTTVTIGNIPCKVISINNGLITCITGKQSTNGVKFHPGNRGMLREVWLSSLPSTTSGVSSLNASSFDYRKEVIPKAAMPKLASFNESTHYSQKFTGYFIAPKDDDYSFMIKSDDDSELYFSTTESPKNKTKIAACPSRSSTWNKFSMQKSKKFRLKAGRKYYLEAIHRQRYSGADLQIGVHIYNSRYLEAQTGQAINELQQIIQTTTVQSEIQILTINNWDNGTLVEIQELYVPYCFIRDRFQIVYSDDTMENDTLPFCEYLRKYRLTFNDAETKQIHPNATAKAIAKALNSLSTVKTIGNVTVSKSSNASGNVYTITFPFNLGPQSKIKVSTFNYNETIVVTEIQKGRSPLLDFSLEWGGEISDSVQLDVTAKGLQANLQWWFSTWCLYLNADPSGKNLPVPTAYFYQDYEGTNSTNESGQRVENILARCGKKSLKNPYYIFRAGKTPETSGKTKPGVDIKRSRYVCFSYKGLMKDSVSFKVEYQNDAGDTYQSWRSYKFTTVQDNQWHDICIDMVEKINSDSQYFSKRASVYTKYIINEIRVYKLKGDLYIDDTYIGKIKPYIYTYRSAAQPNGAIIDGVKVKQLSPGSFQIEMKPFACAYNLGLIKVAHSKVTQAKSDSQTYKGNTWYGNSTVTITRIQAASPPIGGTFDLTFHGKTIYDIKADINELEMKNLLESNFDIGIVQVDRGGSCSGYRWNIKWLTQGGDRASIQTDGSGLAGLSPKIRANTLSDGGIFLGPIPGDMLRTAHILPQVVVDINGISSLCTGDCSYQYQLSSTPTITQITPTSGSGGLNNQGTKITIYGTGFGNSISEVFVNIGEAGCNVTNCTDNNITCYAGLSFGGLRRVEITTAYKGKAKHMSNIPINAKGIYFQYPVIINGIAPLEGSASGGTTLTLHGSGFSPIKDETVVTVGGLSCSVVQEKSNMTSLTCLTSKYSLIVPTLVDVTVSVMGTNTTISNGYKYRNLATVTYFTPNKGSIQGGNLITINGNDFGNSSNLRSLVLIGSSPCKIQTYSNTKITCITTKHARGVFNLSVNIEGHGLAVINGSRSYEYIFQVTNVYPRFGSVTGGTEITIVGNGFGTNTSDLIIKLGSSDCRPFSSNATVIRCVTESSLKDVEIDNSGYNQEFGKGFAWNKPNVTISAGTYIKWSWSAVSYSSLRYGIVQTSSSDTTFYDGKGFISERSATGWFRHQFNVPGIYYYSAGNVDGRDLIKMNGIINVISGKTLTENFSLETVGGYEAIYVNSDVSTMSDSPDCSFGKGRVSLITGCNESSIVNAEPSTFKFTWRSCNTPIISKIEPNIGTSATTIVIKGKGFSTSACQNIVTLGNYSCSVISCSTTEITCKPVLQGSMIAGVRQQISLLVKNLGYSLTSVASADEGSFTLKPTIMSVAPRSGSVAGGTVITIIGDGFSYPKLAVKINGSLECKIKSVSYTQITCVTPAVLWNTNILDVDVHVNGVVSLCQGAACKFAFASDKTPKVNAVSSSTFISGSIVTLSGSAFSAVTTDVIVKVGNFRCNIVSASETSISFTTTNITSGVWDISIYIYGKGNGRFNVSNKVTSRAIITSISPIHGSLLGGTLLTISGGGFSNIDDTSVEIGGKFCLIEYISTAQIKCRTKAKSKGSYNVTVISHGITYPIQTFNYRNNSTPVVTGITPTSGVNGTTVTLTVIGITSGISNINVKIGNAICVIESLNGNFITCVTTANAAGKYNVRIISDDDGKASGSVQFMYILNISSVSPNDSLLGGGRYITIQGNGFDVQGGTDVKVCGKICRQGKNTIITESVITCEVPSMEAHDTNDTNCSIDVSIKFGRQTVTLAKYFKYVASETPIVSSISPNRGSTAGGTPITISGVGFNVTPGKISVSIGGTLCLITFISSTSINCTTGAHRSTEKSLLRVYSSLDHSEGLPIYNTSNNEFYYADLWSSKHTWGGKDPPKQGDYVVINESQTVILDIDTPILKFLLLKGGKLIFDEKDLTLRSEYILITNKGALEVGTADKPFQHNANIVLYGNVRSQELPIYGAKVLAVREGTLDLHGKPIPVTWTRLVSTADQGSTILNLELAVTWQPGDKLILASTSTSPEENEEVVIDSVTNDGKTVNLRSPLRYKHVSVSQNIAGQYVTTRAEVGLLTRNVVVRGSLHSEWIDFVNECPINFDPGQFATQSCFLGRYGNETLTDEFGCHIMLASKEMNQNLIVGRLSYIEVTHAGQAFRLGRYPIHFHLIGDIPTSYIRGCAIYNTFNRAVTIHGVHKLTVEYNVAYNTMGHSYFLEDGIETGNVIQYNLGVFTRQSSSLLNVDITPATFWITNPNNTIRHNAAAGGTHFGYWFKIPTHPEGPSFTTKICPRNINIGQFYNNSAHSFGRFGLWIWPDYHPKVGGTCDSDIDAPAKLEKFLSYRNRKGAEGVNSGSTQYIDFTVLDNTQTGLEIHKVGGKWGEQGPLVKNLLTIGHSRVQGSTFTCQQAGLKTPKSSRLTVMNATFVNFDHTGCWALIPCAFCKPNQGGFPTKFEGITYVNSPHRVRFNDAHECIYEDIDGTLTGIIGGSYVPWNDNLPPLNCVKGEPEISDGSPGATCDDTVVIRRLSWNQPNPSSLLFKDVIVTNQYGSSVSPFRKKRLTHPKGWMVTVVMGEDYNMYWRNAAHMVNISYSAAFYELMSEDYVFINHQLTQIPDFFSTTEKSMNMSDGLPDPFTAENGEWFFNRTIKSFYYITKGSELEQPLYKRRMTPKVYQCYFKDCIKPVPKAPPRQRPLDYRLWSEKSSWTGIVNKAIPRSGEEVVIEKDWWMVLDVAYLPYFKKITIYGALEFDDNSDKVLNTSYIFIHGGQLIIGWEHNPFTHKAHIVLNGNHLTPEIVLPSGPIVGAKAIGVFGYLDMHGKPKVTTWTHLAKTAAVGTNEITLEEPVDWELDDEIIITSSTYEPYQTERMQISHISSDKRTITLYRTLRYSHLSATDTASGRQYSMKAEVGLLTHNLVIEGSEDMAGSLSKQSFGGRVLVGSFQQNDGTRFTGNARIDFVQFKYTGQEGYRDYFDPRFSIAFLDIGFVPTMNQIYSYVRGCSFDQGFNTAIGVFGTENMTISDNVIYRTVGSSVRVWGRKNRIIHNLASLTLATATYNGRYEKENTEWEATFEVNKAVELTLRNNVAAGSQRAGFRIRGEKCYNVDPLISWSNNIAHSNIHGIMMGYYDAEPECTRIANFVSYRNYDYGIFFYQSSRMIMFNITLVDNICGIMPFVYAPASVTHLTANKFVRIQESIIVGTSSSFDCSTDFVIPRDTDITNKHRCPKPASGGRAGMIMTSFVSGTNLAPFKPWHGVKNYPAINGITEISSTIFSNFDIACGKRDIVISTNSKTPDAIHPLEVSRITLNKVDELSKIYFFPPDIGWVNPSDCVDMDCDGQKHALIKDLDGSFLGKAGDTAIGKAEFEWNGDPRRGLGDYRVPKTLLTALNGSRIAVESLAPYKGIVRGNRISSNCSFVTGWNAYKCSGLDHEMFIIESLDKDTETRRISPVALFADGYLDLLNGPQDFGWCHGYTCQERLSTFFTTVSTGKRYDVHFTGTNPQRLRLHLINSNYDQAIVVGIFYSNPQRLDVYQSGVYVNPTNVKLSGSTFEYIPKDPNNPTGFIPNFDGINGLNYYDRSKQTLYILVRGNNPVDIITMPIIQLSMKMPAITVNEFFEKNIVSNIAELLGIDKSKIRFVEVINEQSGARRKRALNTMTVVVEIGNPALPTIQYTAEAIYEVNGTNSNVTLLFPPPTAAKTDTTPSSHSQNYTGALELTTHAEMRVLANKVVEIAQIGAFHEMGYNLLEITVTDPVLGPVDIREGNPYTNTSDSPNGTILYQELQESLALNLNVSNSTSYTYLIAGRLHLIVQPSGSNETVTLPTQPKLVMLDINNNIITQLGHRYSSNPWTVTAYLKSGIGHEDAWIGGNHTIHFSFGYANFTSLSISHNGTYILCFNVSHPKDANFTVCSRKIKILERTFYLRVIREAGGANETVSFSTQPVIEILDVANHERVTNLGWRKRKWFILATIGNRSLPGRVSGQGKVSLLSKDIGIATYQNLSINHAAKDYILEFSVITEPISSYTNISISGSPFEVKERILRLRVVQQPKNCNETVACGQQPALVIYDKANGQVVNNIGWRSRKWFIHAYLDGNISSTLNGQTKFLIPTDGIIQFANLSIYDSGKGFSLFYNISLDRYSEIYTGLSAKSNVFNVGTREFYLQVIVQPSNANESVLFGQQPIVEVYDVGTRKIATPLKGSWRVYVTLVRNPWPSKRNVSLAGTKNLTVLNAQARFHDLLITKYGIGYQLKFTSVPVSKPARSKIFEVLYVNNYSPSFTSSHGLYTSAISEDANIGSFIIAILAKDYDIGPQGKVYYKIAQGNHNDSFRINNRTGHIVTNGSLDREKTPVLTLIITAYDGAIPEKVRSTNATVIITILDVNDNTPYFVKDPGHYIVPESTKIGEIAAIIDARDPDAGENGTLNFTVLSCDICNYFTLNSTTGAFVVNKSLELENSTSLLPYANFTFNISIADCGTPRSRATTGMITLTVVPTNEYPPVFAQTNLSLTIAENTHVGYLVQKVFATDQDIDHHGIVEYYIESGNFRNTFSLAKRTGEITLIQPLDYETYPNYDLVILAQNGKDYKKVARMIIYISVTDIPDTNGDAIVIEGVLPRITPFQSIASLAGIPTFSPIKIILQSKQGNRIDITNEGSKTIFDTTATLNSLVISQRNGATVIIANRATLKQIKVRVINVGVIDVPLISVDFISFRLKAFLFPNINSHTVKSIYRIGRSKQFVKVAIHAYIKISNGETVEIVNSDHLQLSVSSNSSINARIKANESNGILTIDKNNSNGIVVISASFANQTKTTLPLQVTNKIVNISSIISVNLKSLRNNTFSGVANSTIARPEVVIKMTNGDKLLISNFTEYPNLIRFNISQPKYVRINRTTGMATLLANYYDSINFTATALDNPILEASTSFYCNVIPDFGGVHLGELVGPAIMKYPLGFIVNMKIYVNRGFVNLSAINIRLKFDSSFVNIINFAPSHGNDIIFIKSKGAVKIGGLINAADNSTGIMYNIGCITLIMIKSGYPNIVGWPLEIIDDSLKYLRSDIKLKECGKSLMGDSNGDCHFNMLDAAYLKIVSSKVSQHLNRSLDYDQNQIVDYADALFLVKVLYNMARFMKDVSVSIPHNRTDCKLQFIIHTINDHKRIRNDTLDLYVAFTHSNSSITQFMTSSMIEVGRIIPDSFVAGNSVKGIVVKALNDDTGGYYITAATDFVIGEVGVSIFQVIADTKSPLGERVVSSSVGTKLPHVYQGVVRVKLDKNLTVIFQNGFSPMRVYDVSTSTYLCHYPMTTKRVRWKFENNYDQIVRHKEERFRSFMRTTLSSRYPDIDCTGFEITKGSILVQFNATAPFDRLNKSLVMMYTEIQAGISISYNQYILKTVNEMLVDGQAYYGVNKEYPGLNGAKTAGIVVGISLGIIVIILAYSGYKYKVNISSNVRVSSAALPRDITLTKSKVSWEGQVDNDNSLDIMKSRNEQIASIEVTTEATISKAPLPEIKTTLLLPSKTLMPLESEMELPPINSNLEHRLSVSSSRSRGMSIISLPPNYVNDPDVMDGAIEMAVKIKKPFGSFSSLGNISVLPVEYTLANVRAVIMKVLSEKLLEREFIFISEKLEEIHPAKERQFIARDVFKEGIILTKELQLLSNNCLKTCSCGNLAKFECCKEQSYCSIRCQKLDWPFHRANCRKGVLRNM